MVASGYHKPQLFSYITSQKEKRKEVKFSMSIDFFVQRGPEADEEEDERD
jgi:hypothetical protein